MLGILSSSSSLRASNLFFAALLLSSFFFPNLDKITKKKYEKSDKTSFKWTKDLCVVQIFMMLKHQVDNAAGCQTESPAGGEVYVI